MILMKAKVILFIDNNKASYFSDKSLSLTGDVTYFKLTLLAHLL